MTTYLHIRLNARLQPLDRGSVYEDPLQDIFDERLPGSKISGGGTLMGRDGEPTSCDVEIDLDGDPQAGLALVVEALESLGAPKGSIAQLDGGDAQPFGLTEGLGLYLNGTDLSDEVYAQHSPDELLEQLEGCLGDAGAMHSYWEGPRETALYFYGSSEQRMRELIQDVLVANPLAEGHRLVSLT